MTYMFGRSKISWLLSVDWFARKFQDWRLVPLPDVIRLRTKLQEAVSPEDVQMFDTENLLFVPPPCPPPASLTSTDDVIALIQKEFPMVQQLLETFRGHLMLAGGSLCSAVLMREMHTNEKYEEESDDVDADFFFVDVIEERANQMLDEIGALCLRADPNARRYANKLVTTLVVHYKVYQFVHRIYPTPLHVIGGFDLGPSMLFYDGQQVYTNLFGAFCIATGVIVGDVSRRSPSYESRITRYMHEKGLGLLLCNTNARTVTAFAARLVTLAGRGKQRDCVRINIVQGLMLKVKAREATVMTKFKATHGFETIIGIVGARERTSDYFLTAGFDWNDVESYNIRMAMTGQMNQLVWLYKDDGTVTFPVPDRKHFEIFLATRSCSLSYFKLFWPTVDLSKVGQQSRYTDHHSFSPYEMEILFQQMDQAIAYIRYTEQCSGRRIEWITENPGRQWTGSFHPTEIGMSWYNTHFRRPLQIGIPHDAYCLLRCAFDRKQGAFRFLDRDTFRMILLWVCKLMVEEVEHVLLG